MIATSGRVVIDTQKHLITYASDDINKKMLFDPQAAASLEPVFLERERSHSSATTAPCGWPPATKTARKLSSGLEAELNSHEAGLAWALAALATRHLLRPR